MALDIFRQNIRCWMEYGDPAKANVLRVEISAVVINHGLRELPTAIVHVGIGTDIQSGKKEPDVNASPVADVPARIYVLFTGNRGGDRQWDGAARLAFEGSITSVNASRLTNGVSGVYMVRHWSAALASASMLASYAYPGSSAELMLPAYKRRKNKASTGASTGAGGLQALMSQSIVYVDDGEVERSDIWGDIAKEFLILTAEQNPFAKFTQFPSCFPNAGGDNELALAALKRFEGVSTNYGADYQLPIDARWGVPVRLPAEVPKAISRAVKSLLTSVRVADLMQHTAWSYILTQVCSPFMLTVISGISTARIVPLAPTLNKVFATLTPNDGTVLESNRPVEHPLLAVTMSAGQLTNAGGARSNTPGDPFAFGPCYSPAQASPDGMVVQQAPPPWLMRAQFSAFDPAATSRVADGVAGGPMGDPGANDQDAKSETTAEELRVNIQKYGQDYVKAVYAHEVTNLRSVKYLSYPRFDIGPGSQVLIENDNTIAGFGDRIYGMVSKVTIMIDVTKPMAATTFQLSNTRDENENQLDYLAVDKHPLFDDVFIGAPLSAEFE